MGKQTGLFGSTGKQDFHEHRNQRWNGFIGRSLCAALCQEGHRVMLFTRRKEEVQRSCGLTVSAVEWNGLDAEAWEHCLDGADAIINLVGAPIADGRPLVCL
jgi:uncharacterized protein